MAGELKAANTRTPTNTHTSETHTHRTTTCVTTPRKSIRLLPGEHSQGVDVVFTTDIVVADLIRVMLTARGSPGVIVDDARTILLKG